jgi:small-conductance mechanosensitive channel
MRCALLRAPTRTTAIILLTSALVATTPLALAMTRPRTAVAAVKSGQSTSEQSPSSDGDANALQDAAERAGRIGRSVALSLIGLALAVAAVVLVFRRDFREAAGVFAVGLLAVLLATPSGLSLLRSTADMLFGSR